MKILILEDDDRIAKPLAEDLKHQYHVVEVANDGNTPIFRVDKSCSYQTGKSGLGLAIVREIVQLHVVK